jgi:hypothetical protein
MKITYGINANTISSHELERFLAFMKMVGDNNVKKILFETDVPRNIEEFTFDGTTYNVLSITKGGAAITKKYNDYDHEFDMYDYLQNNNGLDEDDDDYDDKLDEKMHEEIPYTITFDAEVPEIERAMKLMEWSCDVGHCVSIEIEDQKVLNFNASHHNECMVGDRFMFDGDGSDWAGDITKNGATLPGYEVYNPKYDSY